MSEELLRTFFSNPRIKLDTFSFFFHIGFHIRYSPFFLSQRPSKTRKKNRSGLDTKIFTQNINLI